MHWSSWTRRCYADGVRSLGQKRASDLLMLLTLVVYGMADGVHFEPCAGDGDCGAGGKGPG